MGAAYSVGPIRYDQVDRTYCLIEAVGYDVDLDEWRNYCAATLVRKRHPGIGTVVTVENALGYVSAVGVSRAERSKRHGHVLDVPVFIVASAGDTPGACDALLHYLLASARKAHCGLVRIASPEPTNWPGSPICSKREGILIPVL